MSIFDELVIVDGQVTNFYQLFELVRYLDQGTQGSVYLIRDKKSSKQYAMKLTTERADREIRFLQKLKHPMTVQYYTDFVLPPGSVSMKISEEYRWIFSFSPDVPVYVLILEYLDGQPLYKIVSYSHDEIVSIAKSLIDYVILMDELGINDVDFCQPCNFMKCTDGTYRKFDLGQCYEISEGKNWMANPSIRTKDIQEKYRICNLIQFGDLIECLYSNGYHQPACRCWTNDVPLSESVTDPLIREMLTGIFRSENRLTAYEVKAMLA
jgi:serine/threonine protein kinase